MDVPIGRQRRRAYPETVYLTAHGTLYALDVKTGRQRWAAHADPLVSSWGPVGGLVYAYETNGDARPR